MIRWVEIHVLFGLGLALTISMKHELWLLVAGTVDLKFFWFFLLGSLRGLVHHVLIIVGREGVHVLHH